MLPTAFEDAIAQFNRGEFYACHDTLEALWFEALEPEKTFYQGILQVAVACYHLENENRRGAVMLLGEGVRRLRDYQPDYGGIDVAQLMTAGLNLLHHLQQSSDRIELGPTPLPQIIPCHSPPDGELES
ncbi:DUF309 domain-containing protein [Spirulina sp. CCNP1310]|uniref:DUF309 domain-containing protein n=1 Tax=Spirulina sp. CCNP1310 TaxID=3110249 RepID=UPI002B20A9E2|nr:DUF309 domain-containing protein [Spirulina sp. CCNP1310]MEA5420449.1 DUF309 domain-containing protein [Spirulina sp. CCNP1310]